MSTWFTPAEVAEQMGVSVKVVRRLISEKRLRARRVSRGYLIHSSALEEFEQGADNQEAS